MCTALISVDPGSRVPVLLVFARDEMAERAWLPPGHHWPEHQELVAGMDLREGGTWLAARSGAARDADGEADASAGPRVVALLNGFGVFAAPERRRTRGRLPLLVASGAPLADLDLTRYDPFHLLVADDAGVSMLTWDGVDLTDQELAPGTHLVSNRGLEVEGDVDFPRAPERAVTLIEAGSSTSGPCCGRCRGRNHGPAAARRTTRGPRGCASRTATALTPATFGP